MYMACTEEDDDVDSLRERTEDAQYWLNDAKAVMERAGLLEHPRVSIQEVIAALKMNADSLARSPNCSATSPQHSVT